MRTITRAGRAFAAISAGAALMLSACTPIALVGQAFRGDRQVIDVEAQYRGLEGKSVAVLVGADEYLLYEHPKAPLNICRAVTARLADNLGQKTGLTVVDPQQVMKFQRNNPAWHAVPYGQLLEHLGVERLVIVDLIEYRTHEPGNAHIWQGVVAGQVSVASADAEDPDQPVFATTVRAQFPEESTIGVINSNDEAIQLGMISLFSRDASGLFYDYQIVRE